MFDDPGVRSVRVALALCERFTELLKGPTTVRTSKQRGALVGVSGDQEGLSMRIGEAQQLYPEIWRHLDDARTTFAARGIDVSAFDRIRETEGQALGASVDVHQQSYGYGSRGVDQLTKTAGFNREGLARARQACDALMKATPEIDWAAIAKAESNDPAAADFARAVRIKRYTRLALLALVIASPFIIVLYMRHQERAKRDAYRAQYEPTATPTLGATERAALAKRVAELRPSVTAARAAWPAAVTASALAKTPPGSQPCPIAMPPPPQAAIDAFVRDDVVAPTFAASDFLGYLGDKPVPDAPMVNALAIVDAVDRHLASGTADSYDVERIASIQPHIAFVLIDHEQQPRITEGDVQPAGYIPGSVVGRAYVFSLRDAKIVCAGAIDVRNAEPGPGSFIDGRTRDIRSALHRELEVRIRQALATGLRAVP